MNRRANGFGTLINKGEGRAWLARWVYKGEVFYRTTGETDKKKALKQLEVITRPYREKRAIDVERNLLLRIQSMQECVAKNILPIDRIWTEFAKKLKHDDVSSGTSKIYEGAVNHLMRWFKSKTKDASGITTKLAEEYLDELDSSIGTNTYNIRLVLFKRIWKSLKDDFRLDDEVWEKFKKKKAAKSSRRTMQNVEIADVISNAETKDMRLLLTIGLYTGLRISDSSLLKWSEVDFEKKVLRVRPIKTRKHMDGPIEIPIHPALLKLLEEMPHASEYVSEPNADDYKNGHASGKVVELFRKCGIETSKKENGKTKLVCGFHSLRHTFVSNAINSGMSPLLVQKIVGHSSVDMTASYFHDTAAKAAEGINAMPDVA